MAGRDAQPEFVVDWPTLFVAVDWVAQHCIVPDGFGKGQRFEPYDWQAWCLLNFYRVKPDAVWVPNSPVLAPAFHYRRSQVLLPQKALALDTPVPTPSGWSTMGDLQVADEVFDAFGEPTRVVAKSPVQHVRTYRVTFSDGAALVACGDHEWVVDRRTPSGTYVPERLRTKDMLGGLVDPYGARRFRVRNARPLTLPDHDLPLDPYVLGAWLGDGNSDDGRMTGLDREVFARIETAGYEIRQLRSTKQVNVAGLRTDLRLLGVLKNKHIPAAYLRASEKQRWALLQGLMDTDGYADERQGKCEFTTTRPALRDGVRELLYSLGIRHICYSGLATLYGRVTGPKWRVSFAARSDMPVFHLERKQARLQPPRGHAQFEHRRVVDITVDPTVPTQCIQVASPSRTFLAGREMIPTGNSGKAPYTAAQICLQGVGPVLFAGWAKGGETYDCRNHGCGCGWIYTYEPGEAMGMPWPTPLIQITAYSQEQTSNIYDALRPMIDDGPLHELIPKTGEEFIRLPGGGRIDAVTSSAQSRLGQRVTYVPQDETPLWTEQNKMINVAETQRRGLAGMGGRGEETGNAPDPTEDSVALRTLKSNAKDVFRYFPQAPKSLSFKDKRERRKIMRHVYGSSLRDRGGHIDLDSIEAEALELMELDPGQAERFFGNRSVAGAGHWCDSAKWAKRAAGPREVGYDTQVVLGMDGSDTGDWTAIRAETQDGYQFTPTFGPDELPTIWNPADYGGQVPRLEVAAAVDELFTRYRVIRFYADPPYWETEIDDWAARLGDQVVLRFATWRIVQMHAAAERLLTDVVKRDSGFSHDGCKITDDHVGNARKAPRPSERYVLVKASPPQKIDASVASVLAHEAACDATAADLWLPDSVIYTASSTSGRG
jgi:hypothetical protein